MPWARVWMSAVMALSGFAVLYLDSYLAPWYPILMAFTVAVAAAGLREYRSLIREPHRPRAWLLYPGLLLLFAAYWLPPAQKTWPATIPEWLSVSDVQLACLVAVLAAGFLLEMALYAEPGPATARLAFGMTGLLYMGVMAGCVVRLRWVDIGGAPGGDWGQFSLPLAIVFFVPKAGDTAGYIIGKLFGRWPMSPRLSPNKTWVGFCGIVAGSAAAMYGLLHGVAGRGALTSLAFGAAVGAAGQLGDLAESMVKRDGGSKDAAKTLPGFGGVLDVVDSIVFAAPLVWLWLSLM